MTASRLNDGYKVRPADPGQKRRVPGSRSGIPAGGIVDLASGRLDRTARWVDRVANVACGLVDLLARPLGRALVAADPGQRQEQPAQHEGQEPWKFSNASTHSA